jgi:amino acid adenylation domain-containing protein
MPTRLTVACPPDFVPFPRESILQGIHERFEHQVRLHPQNTAFRTAGTALTYTQANGYANSIAEKILSVSGTELGQVAILLPNTPDIVIHILAALKAHKAYVPLDPSFPPARLKIMSEDAEPRVLLTDSHHMELARELAGGQTCVLDTSCIERHADAPNPGVHCDPLDRAYILYTSGSTGRPKGIAFLHRNLLHTTMCLINRLFFSASDRVTWLHSASFAASVVDLYCSLLTGATLYPWDAKVQGFTGLADWLVRERVTTFQWIPSAFRQFLRTVPADFVFPDIRIVVMASEPLTAREIELFRRHFRAGSHLVNQVGTSESYNYRLYAVDHHLPVGKGNVAGGYAVSEDRRVLILDEQRRVLPPGRVGEIGVRSDYMSAGYWHDPALTARKFVRVGGDDVPVYLTGDLGRLEPDDCLIHLGRKDFQVKIRGYRVELAEVEHVLATAPGVLDAAAWVVKNQLGDDQLVGYVLLDDDSRFDPQQTEKHLESRLPDYMVPRHYVVLDALPILATGKIDRKALPNPFEPREPGPEPMQRVACTPDTPKQTIIRIFRELLQAESIKEESHFFRLGGDSLLAALLMHRIYEQFHVEIDIDGFADSPTPKRLADLVQAGIQTRKRSP